MRRTGWLWLLKLLVTAGLIIAMIRFVDLGQVWHRLQSVDPGLVASAVFCVALGYVLCGLRWAWVASGLGFEVSRERKVRLYFLGMFASLFLPSTIGGDVIRGILLGRGEGRSGMGLAAGASVVLDRANGLGALFVLITLCMAFFDWPAYVWGSWLAGAGATVLGLVLLPWIYARLPGPLARLKALPLDTPRFRRMWMQSFPVSLAFQVLIIQAHYLLGSAVGLDMPWPAFAVMVGLIGLVAILPISLNGFGVREAGYVGLAVFFGGSADAATAMAALWVIVLAIASLPGAWVLWRLGGTREVTRANAGSPATAADEKAG